MEKFICFFQVGVIFLLILLTGCQRVGGVYDNHDYDSIYIIFLYNDSIYNNYQHHSFHNHYNDPK